MKTQTLIPHGIKALCILAAGVSTVALADPPRRPNVIIVMTDDQGYGDLSCHGNPVLKTPNLDRLHDRSVRLTDFHVAPMCTPTRGQLMTGRDALDNGATFVNRRSMMRHDLPTMAGIFAANGYRTGLFGKWHLGDSYPARPIDRGFDTVIRHGAWGITSIADHFGNDYFDDTYLHNGRYEPYEGYCTDVWLTLYRWPPEAETALDAPLAGPGGRGRAIPVRAARVRIGDFEQTWPTSGGAISAVCRVTLDAGEYALDTRFLDGDGKPLCSAYYVTAELLP